MSWKWIKRSVVPVLALALVVTGCEDVRGPEHLMAPESSGPAFSDGHVVAAGTYRPVRGVWKGTRIETRVIQPRSGGDVGVGGTVVIIPAGAVAEPTRFEVRLVPADVDGTTRAQVELRAYARDRTGQFTVDVGAKGFLKPLKFRMSYDWATDRFDPEALRIVWLRPDGGQEVYHTTLDPSGRTVSTELNHFSDYIMAIP